MEPAGQAPEPTRRPKNLGLGLLGIQLTLFGILIAGVGGGQAAILFGVIGLFCCLAAV